MTVHAGTALGRDKPQLNCTALQPYLKSKCVGCVAEELKKFRRRLLARDFALTSSVTGKDVGKS